MAGFWVFILSFAILAVAELVWRARPADQSGRRLTTNFMLGGINILISATLPVGVAGAAGFADARGLGLLNQIGAPAAVALLATLLGRTLAIYWTHRLMHRAPLWRLHRVHHADRHVDLSTALRNHPAELIVALAVAGATIVALGAPLWAVAVTEAALLASNLWSHANLRLPAAIDRRLARVLVTPGVHLVHHSASRAECDSNYGELLTLWDRLFGTYSSAPAVARTGLGNTADAQADNLLRQLGSPFGKA